ncbi:MAG: hypothetical protein ACFFDW_02910 [Candidatus Thorarchaeota archaeon]
MESIELDSETSNITKPDKQIGRIFSMLGVLLSGIYFLLLFIADILLLISSVIEGSITDLTIFYIISNGLGIIGGIFFIVGIICLQKKFKPFIGENLKKMLIYFTIFVFLYHLIGFLFDFTFIGIPSFLYKMRVATDGIGLVMLILTMYELKNTFKEIKKIIIVFNPKLVLFFANVVAVCIYIISRLIASFGEIAYMNAGFLVLILILYILSFLVIFIGTIELGLKFLTLDRNLLLLLSKNNRIENKIENDI